jgi:hypothetical protein
MGVEQFADPEALDIPVPYEHIRFDQGMKGHVDSLRSVKSTLFAEGWSYDPRSNEPAYRIAVVASDQVVYSRRPTVERPDLVAVTGRESVRYCGFRFRIQGVPEKGLRVLAFSAENIASEIQ